MYFVYIDARGEAPQEKADNGMVQKHGGSIVNITSQAARSGGLVVTSDYSASKAGIIALTKSLAKVGAKDGIIRCKDMKGEKS